MEFRSVSAGLLEFPAGLRYSNVHYKIEDYYIVGANLDNSGKTDYDKLLPSAALSWAISPHLNSYAKGFETPAFTEMAYSANDGMNFSLKPASSGNYELGLKAQNAWGNFTAALFQSKTQHDIVSAGNIDGRSAFRNADKTLREGLELSGNKTLWRELTAQASCSYLDAVFDADIPELRDDKGKVAAAYAAKGNAIPGIAEN